MPRRFSTRAIVLQTFDVGEADRFCILFTEQYGKLAARARAVRRPGSRMGGSLLPLRLILLDIVEHKAGAAVTDARPVGAEPRTGDLTAFLEAAEGMEALSMLLHDGEPLPEIFAHAAAFLERCARGGRGEGLSFMVRLLTLLGHMPDHRDPLFHPLQDADRGVIASLRAGEYPASTFSPEGVRRLRHICEHIVHEQTGRRGRAQDVAMAMNKGAGSR